MSSFEDELLFTTDYIIERFQKPLLHGFIAKNLSWGIFKSVFTNGDPSFSSQFYDHYMTALKKYNVNCPAPELLLFTMIELIGSTSYNCIHNSQPVRYGRISAVSAQITASHITCIYRIITATYITDIYRIITTTKYIADSHRIVITADITGIPQNSYRRRYHWHPQNSYRGDIVSAHIHG